jgi:hypothetical protein
MSVETARLVYGGREYEVWDDDPDKGIAQRLQEIVESGVPTWFSAKADGVFAEILIQPGVPIALLQVPQPRRSRVW